MTALSAACCARWNPLEPRASNHCSRPGTGSPRPRRTWRQKLIDPPSPQRIWQSFILPVPFFSGMECGRRAITVLVCTCRSTWKKALLKKNGPCSSTESEACAMPINILSRQSPLKRRCRRGSILQRGSSTGWRDC